MGLSVILLALSQSLLLKPSSLSQINMVHAFEAPIKVLEKIESLL